VKIVIGLAVALIDVGRGRAFGTARRRKSLAGLWEFPRRQVEAAKTPKSRADPAKLQEENWASTLGIGLAAADLCRPRL